MATTCDYIFIYIGFCDLYMYVDCVLILILWMLDPLAPCFE